MDATNARFKRAVRAKRAARLAEREVACLLGDLLELLAVLLAFAVAELCVFFSALLLLVLAACSVELGAGVDVVCAATGSAAISHDNSIAVMRRAG